MTEQPPINRLEEAVALADQLNARHARTLLEELPAQSGGRLAQLRRTLISKLNGLRPNRTRRLFTSLIEPYLTDDPALLLPFVPAPMTFHRADAAGLWSVLARNAFPKLALETAPLLDQLCEALVVDDALTSHTAVEARDRMRLATIAYLSNLLENRAALDRLLDAVNIVRARELQKSGVEIHALAPLGRRQIQDEATLLKAAPILLADLPRRIDEVVQLAARDEGAAAAALIDGETALRDALMEAKLPVEAATALPLTVLHNHRLYGVIAIYLKRLGLRQTNRVAEALLTHFSGVGHRLARLFSALTTPGRAQDSIADPRMSALIDGDLVRLSAIVAALHSCGIPKDAVHYHMMREATSQFLRDLGGGKRGPGGRSFDAILNRLGPLTLLETVSGGDYPEMVWLLTTVGRIHTILSGLGLVLSETGRFREQAIRDILFAAGRVTRIENENHSHLISHFDHLERLETLAHAIGRTVLNVLSSTSRHTQLIFISRLKDPRPLSDIAQALITGFVTVARDEVAKIRYWRNADLIELIEAAEGRGL